MGAKHAICISNGTVSLEIALLAMGVGKSDEVITSPCAFANEGEKPCTPRRFRSFLGMVQDVFRKTVRNQSTESLDNFVITKNKEWSIQFPEIRLIP